MKTFLQAYFSKYEQSSFIDQQRAKALFYIGSISAILIFFVTIISYINHTEKKGFFEHALVPFIMIAIVLGVLALLRSGKLSLAGNILVTGVLVLQILSLLQRLYSAPVYMNFIGGTYYFLLLIIVLGLLFSTRLNLIINFVLVLITTLFIVSTNKLSNDASIQKYLILSQIDYTITLIILSLTVWYSKLISARSSNLIEKEIEAKMQQNKLLSELLEQIKKSSGRLFENSNKLARISNIISQNSTEQSATTEQIAAAMEEIFNSIVATAENASYTEKISTQTAFETLQNREIFDKTIVTISEITQKVSIINEISGKTDILSINAAIEAARSAEHGQGFAVVAQEIRKLADKTKTASEIIDKLSKEGVEISKNAGERISKLIPEIQKSAELISNIKLMSQEQQIGVQAINLSVQELSMVTLKNAEESEKMAASANDLFAEAEQLKKLTTKVNFA